MQTTMRTIGMTGLVASLMLVALRGQGQAYPPPPGTAPAGPPPAQPYPYYPPSYYPPSPAPLPSRMRYIEGRPIPPGYHVESEPRKGLITTGAILLAVPYGISASIAASSKHDGDTALLIPVAGPFIDLSTRGTDCSPSTPVYNSSSCDTQESNSRFALTFDGLSQATGAVLLILGLAWQQQVLERDDAPLVGRSRPTFKWALAPRSLGGHGIGLGVIGQF